MAEIVVTRQYYIGNEQALEEEVIDVNMRDIVDDNEISDENLRKLGFDTCSSCVKWCHDDADTTIAAMYRCVSCLEEICGDCYYSCWDCDEILCPECVVLLDDENLCTDCFKERRKKEEQKCTFPHP